MRWFQQVPTIYVSEQKRKKSVYPCKPQCYYTPQNKLRVTQCFSPYVDYWVCSVAQTRQDIEKHVSASFKGIKNEAFPVKNLAFKIFIFILCKIRHFCQNFKKSCFILFIDVWPLCCQWYIVIVSFLTKLYAFL